MFLQIMQIFVLLRTPYLHEMMSFQHIQETDNNDKPLKQTVLY